ncbi:cytochrome c peroxidase [Chitinophaga skermanii]|uniref:Cytochrome c peroxidase n=2 Tax=Chitinophaga skermanii TaxID=331697 RepID=A0A327QKU8_9BACT|nr:cytochrome c peroxidase [Chitinophaga skermanii]
MKKAILIITCIALLASCSKEVVDKMFSFTQPANFPVATYHFNTNEITKAKFELGRKLFYEPRLSRDNTVSCGTCHIQSAGFTHHGHDVSHGIDDRLGSRNSPPIMNLAWRTSFFWDGGVFDLDLQPVAPIINPVEMDETMDNVLAKLRAHPTYPSLFEQAFGTKDINEERFLKSLSQFMVMLVSDQSKYDQVKRHEGATFTASEQAGYELFLQHCNTCHREPLFTDESFRNNGIGIGPNNDEGRYLVTLNPADRYKFKVPSLRNLSYTAPYMHDGRFLNLQGVLEHYANGVKEVAGLDPLLEHGIPLTPAAQQQLIDFLKTLNDESFIKNPLFAEQ